MPRYDYHLTLPEVLGRDARIVLRVTQQMVNQLRHLAGVPLLRDADMLALVRQALQDERARGGQDETAPPPGKEPL